MAHKALIPGMTAKVLTDIWGASPPMCTYLWPEDMADAWFFFKEQGDFKDYYEYSETAIRNTQSNIGTQKDNYIANLGMLIKEPLKFPESFNVNKSNADGTKKKLTEVSKAHRLGWPPRLALNKGISLYHLYPTQHKPVKNQ